MNYKKKRMKKELKILDVIQQNNNQTKSLHEWLMLANEHLKANSCTQSSFSHILDIMYKSGQIELSRKACWEGRYYTMSRKVNQI